MYFCRAFVYSIYCESCTRPISTNLIQAGELALTRGACFATSRLKLAAVVVLLWSRWPRTVCFRYVFQIQIHTALQIRSRVIYHWSTSSGVHTGFHHCISMFRNVTAVYITDCESGTRPI